MEQNQQGQECLLCQHGQQLRHREQAKLPLHAFATPAFFTQSSGFQRFRISASQGKKTWTSLLRYFWKIPHHPDTCCLPSIRNPVLKGTGPVSGTPWRETHEANTASQTELSKRMPYLTSTLNSRQNTLLSFYIYNFAQCHPNLATTLHFTDKVQACFVVQSLSRVRLFVTPTDCSTPGFPVLHRLLEIAQIHVR